MDDFKEIIVTKGSPKVRVKKNPTSYKLIGKGIQGAVFKISSERCVKIYPEEKHAAMEQAVLQAAKGSQYFPMLYESGKNYTVMEFVSGITLRDYLFDKNEIPIHIVEQLLTMLKEREQLGIPRVDANLRHVIISDDHTMKVIDHVNSFKKKLRVPKSLTQGLKNLGLLEDFLKKVRVLDEETFIKWKKSRTIGKYISKYRL
ncbi:putative Ser/Thr protein kinase [Desulfitispora alkaliphila]|uniref:hypothetical protein n=1 Tax=Desulfitispora alkaliphila TaxID=622674 RepID=UPI003D21C7F9